MGFAVKFSLDAAKEIESMDRGTAKFILGWIDKNLAGIEDPFSRGKALSGNLAKLWRYRIGDYRLITKIEKKELIILAIDVGHRSTV